MILIGSWEPGDVLYCRDILDEVLEKFQIFSFPLSQQIIMHLFSIFFEKKNEFMVCERIKIELWVNSSFKYLYTFTGCRNIITATLFLTLKQQPITRLGLAQLRLS